MKKRKIINIISGKGGTGKTLFAAILADLLGNQGSNILVIDLDIFVRGLTALLYFHKGESINIVEKDEVTVSDFFIEPNVKYLNKKLALYRYRSFDVLPSVPRIDSVFNLTDLVPDNREKAISILKSLLSSIEDKYDYIFLDSRAGYDELISATYLISDISICVQEEDEISNVTANNLVRQLEKDSNNSVFRVINKARYIRKYEDIYSNKGFGLNYLGSIPFDIDVMNSFGKATFWEDIYRTFYRSAVAEVWNTLSKKMGFDEKIYVKRISPIGTNKLEKKLSSISIMNRVLFFYGIVLTFGGLIYFIFGPSIENVLCIINKDPSRLLALLISLLGLLMSIFSILRKQKLK